MKQLLLFTRGKINSRLKKPQQDTTTTYLDPLPDGKFSALVWSAKEAWDPKGKPKSFPLWTDHQVQPRNRLSAGSDGWPAPPAVLLLTHRMLPRPRHSRPTHGWKDDYSSLTPGPRRSQHALPPATENTNPRLSSDISFIRLSVNVFSL